MQKKTPPQYEQVPFVIAYRETECQSFLRISTPMSEQGITASRW